MSVLLAFDSAADRAQVFAAAANDSGDLGLVLASVHGRTRLLQQPRDAVTPDRFTEKVR